MIPPGAVVATWVDRSGWKAGPWDGEPDRVVWADPLTGYDCLTRRNDHLGNWCGYVGVEPGHPRHGASTDAMADFDVHGDINFAEPCDDDTERGICHVPEPGRADHVWWFGFDCAHFMDLAPGLEAIHAELGIPPLVAGGHPFRYHYWTFDEVRHECTRLARQLHDDERHGGFS